MWPVPGQSNHEYTFRHTDLYPYTDIFLVLSYVDAHKQDVTVHHLLEVANCVYWDCLLLLRRKKKLACFQYNAVYSAHLICLT